MASLRQTQTPETTEDTTPLIFRMAAAVEQRLPDGWSVTRHHASPMIRIALTGTIAAPWLDVEYKQTIPADVLRAVGEALIAAANEQNGGRS